MYGAQSEYKSLRKVLMHTPRESVELVDERSYSHYLFMTPVFRRRFIEEHDAFIDLLRSEGVEVLLVEEVLKDDEAALNRIRGQPNLTYMRDTISIMNGGYVKMKMASKVRQPETALSERAAQKLGIPCLLRITGDGMLEGGDFVYLDEDCLMIGVGRRSNKQGVMQVVRSALGRDLSQLIMVPLFPWNVHLDGALMVVDDDLAVGHLDSLRKPATLYQTGQPPEKINLLTWLKERGIEVIEVGSFERQMRGTNVVCLAPGKCVMYKWVDKTARELSEHGVDVLAIEGSELLRGGGGPHCMTAPILRA